MDNNPYQTPDVIEIAASPAEDAEAIRREHIKHEAQVKSIGGLYCLGAFFMLFGAAGVVTRYDQRSLIFSLLYVLLIVLQLILGVGLRRLKPWARIGGIALSAVGLFAFPTGTIISLVVLLMLASKKSGVVFSKDYQAVIAATPHVKYKTSKVVWIALGLFVLVILAIALIGFFTTFTSQP